MPERFSVYGWDMDEQNSEMKNFYGRLPLPGMPVQVQCDGIKCMAFLDKEGRWVDLFSLEILPHVLGVVPVCDDSSPHIFTRRSESGKKYPENPVNPV